MRFGLVGADVSRSLSPELHRLFGCGDYGLLSAPEGDFRRFMAARGFCGINVTMPYKTAALEYCDELSETAARIGCVNTVVNRGGRLFGYNTDLFGLRYMLSDAGIDPAGKRVAILGGGATYRTACEAALSAGAAEIWRVSRSGAVSYADMYGLPADILINTTPVGMGADSGSLPARPERFSRLSAVADVVYDPPRTALVLRAARLGMRAAGGLMMLAAQAKASAELFYGVDIPDGAVRAACDKVRLGVSNIVLTGMAGCGKTSVGRLIARMLARPFIDTDEEAERIAGLSVGEIFRRCGEAGFRELEREVIRGLEPRTGAVIAVGGGAPMAEENRDALARRGMIVLLRREAGELDISGRPLSASRDAAIRLLEERAPVYEAFCDIAVDNSGAPEDAAKAVIKELGL